MDGTHDDLINIVTAAEEDIETMMSQNKTITDLTKNVATLTRQLQQETSGKDRGPGLPGDRQSQTHSKWVNRKQLQDVGGYCWTHGHCLEIGHDSKTYRYKKVGHKENATRADNMGENSYGKPRE